MGNVSNQGVGASGYIVDGGLMGVLVGGEVDQEYRDNLADVEYMRGWDSRLEQEVITSIVGGAVV